MFTKPIVDEPDAHLTPLPAETRTYELRKPTQETSDMNEPTTNLYRFNDLLKYINQAGDGKHDILYEDIDFTKAKEAAEHDKEEENNYFRRLIEQARILYRPDDLGAAEDDTLALLELGTVQPQALPGESYKLAFTPGLLAQVFQRRDGQPLLPDDPNHPNNVNNVLGGQGGDQGGYVSSQQLKAEGKFPDTDPDDNWWIPIGRAFMSPNPDDTAAAEVEYARNHFFLPLRYRDPFHTQAISTESFVTLDAYDLLMLESRDSVGNRVTAGERDAVGNLTTRGNNYRVLQSYLMMDPNRNRAIVAFDALGMVVGTAVMGKPDPSSVEGDSLAGFEPDLTEDFILDHLTNPLTDPHSILRHATTRMIYDPSAYYRTKDQQNPQPNVVYSIVRETHDANLEGDTKTKVQHSFFYSDGFGREIQKKIQAEAGPLVEGGPVVSPRWVGSGWTIFNNKGKPIRQYEPFFDDTHSFKFGKEVGVSPILFYDPVGRVVATLHPNHTYEKVVFNPWRQSTWDVNDTIKPAENPSDPPFDPKNDEDVGHYFRRLDDSEYLPTWYDLRTDEAKALEAWPDTDTQGNPLPDNAKRRASEKSAAEKVANAHADTPTTMYFDTLGRTFLTVAHNKVFCEGHDHHNTEEKFYTRIHLDIEGNHREVRDTIVQEGDSQGRIVMRYDYDMLGNRIHQLSMEAGERWTLNDVAGKPIRLWRNPPSQEADPVQAYEMEYDELRRPIRSYVTEFDPADFTHRILFERIIYGEQHPQAEARNLRGSKVYLQCDGAGVYTSEQFDFKGNLVHSTRRLAKEYKESTDWTSVNEVVPLDSKTPFTQDALETALSLLLDKNGFETFSGKTKYDALNRALQVIAPHSNQPGSKLNVIQPAYNEANLLEQVHVWLDHPTEPEGLVNPVTVPPSPVGVDNIDYDAKGQRLRIDYKNGTITLYEYDKHTFRLIHLLTLRNADTFPDDCPQHPPDGWRGCQVQNLHYTYDPVGNITKIRDDAQQKIFFKNMRVEPSAEYTYDAIYWLIEATGREHLGQSSGSAPTPHSYNDASHVGRPHPNERDAMGRYKELYVYDGAGNISEMHHYRAADRSRPAWTRSYVYDETSLIEDGRANGTLRKTSNRLSSTTIEGNNPPVERHAYDFHGNMIKMPQLQLMQYDFKDQLSMTQRQKVNDQDGDGAKHHGERTYYSYDSTGQRTRKITELPSGRLKDERIYLGQFEVYRRHSGANTGLVRETLHIMDDKQRIAMVETRNDVNDDTPEQLIRYQFANHLGSAVLELDEEAKIISYEEYYPYGATSYQAGRNTVELSLKRYRYTGMERDEESGLAYHTTRYYMSWLGRWISADPIGVVGGINLYAYSKNNPLALHDRNGLQPETPNSDPWFRSEGHFIHQNNKLYWTKAGSAKEELHAEEVSLDQAESILKQILGRELNKFEFNLLFSVPSSGTRDVSILSTLKHAPSESNYLRSFKRVATGYRAITSLEPDYSQGISKTGSDVTYSLTGDVIKSRDWYSGTEKGLEPPIIEPGDVVAGAGVARTGARLLGGVVLRQEARALPAEVKALTATMGEEAGGAIPGSPGVANRIFYVGPEGASTTEGIRYIDNLVVHDTQVLTNQATIRSRMKVINNYYNQGKEGGQKGIWYTGTHGDEAGNFGGNLEDTSGKWLMTERPIGRHYNWDVKSYKEMGGNIPTNPEVPTVLDWCWSGRCIRLQGK